MRCFNPGRPEVVREVHHRNRKGIRQHAAKRNLNPRPRWNSPAWALSAVLLVGESRYARDPLREFR